ncbi:hypothetical protein [Vitiosangium sp. GDMCC 1.1324]|uniref:hypothetical protein n=1 Tax=Vitiosangium sp. (strain GDMCC 1.1324) TaxID=2138576 RepID=UPI00130DACA9|nr:hypothetical protein [Vitiosangium sp. GDMCC 1.1324]
MLNLSNVLNELTEEQMDRVLEFKAGWEKSHGSKSKSHRKSSKSHKKSHSSRSHHHHTC